MAEQEAGDGFIPVEASLEDVYFSQITNRATHVY